MSEHDIVAEWLQAAFDDYDSAKYLFDRPHKKALEIICYHCQQSTEKSLKAFLVANDVVITRTHDTGMLYRQCVEIEGTFSTFEKICEEFTIYATETRQNVYNKNSCSLGEVGGAGAEPPLSLRIPPM